MFGGNTPFCLVLLVLLGIACVSRGADDAVTAGAGEGLFDFSKSLPEEDANQVRYFAQALSHSDPEVRRKTLEKIRRHESHQKLLTVALIQPLAELLQSPETSRDAAALLEELGEPALPAIAPMLEHEEHHVRIQAAESVLRVLKEYPWTQSAAFGHPQKYPNVVRAEAVEIVLDALEDPGAGEWMQTGEVAQYVPNSERYRVAELLLHGLVVGSRREMAAMGLAQIGNDGVPALVVAATDESAEVREAALEGIRRYASNEDDRRTRELRALLPVLEDLTDDPSDRVRALATRVVAVVERQLAKKEASELSETNWQTASARAREAWLKSTLQVLGISSADPEIAIPELAKLLSGPASDKRESPEVHGMKQGIAAQALAAFGEPAKEHLLRALKQDEPYVRAAAMDAIGDQFPEFEDAVPLLIEYLSSEDKTVRHRAARTLGQMKLTRQQSLPALEEALKEELRGIPQAIASYGTAVEPRLLERISDPEDPAGEHAVEVFAHFDEPPSDEAIRQLIDLLGSDNEKVLHRARRALEAGWEFTRPRMLEALHSHPNPLVRRWLALSTMLGEIGFYRHGPVIEAVPAVPALLQALEDPNRDVQLAAALALSTVAPGVARWSESLREMAPLLAEAALDPPRHTALNPVRPLRVLGKHAEGVIPQMVRAVQAAGLQEEAQLFLVDRGAAAVPALRDALRQRQEHHHREILEVLQQIGPPARDAAPELVELTRTAGPDERLFGARALAGIQAAPEIALATVREALQSGRANFLEDRALDVLVHLVAFHPPAAEELAQLLTLSRLDPETNLPQWPVSSDHLNALGEAGSNARPIAPALQEVALGHSWSGGREAAFAALQKIDPEAAAELASRFYRELAEKQEQERNRRRNGTPRR